MTVRIAIVHTAPSAAAADAGEAKLVVAQIRWISRSTR
jgi:hypothetical protein